MSENEKPIRPDQLVPGQRYYIVKGFGEGREGICVETRKNDFGHKWGLIVLTEHERYWTRYQLLQAR